MRSLPLTNRMSSQPSPSASRKAQPAPMVSGSQRLPVRPALWVNLMPAAAVTSVKRAGSAPTRVTEVRRAMAASFARAGVGLVGRAARKDFLPRDRLVVVVDGLPFIVVLGAGEPGLLG